MLIYIYLCIDEHKYDFVFATIHSIKICIGYAPGYLPKRIIGKAIIAMFMCYGLILSSLFQSASLNSMTKYYHRKQLSSIEEAFEQQYDIAAMAYTYNILSQKSDQVNRTFIFSLIYLENSLFFNYRFLNKS